MIHFSLIRVHMDISNVSIVTASSMSGTRAMLHCGSLFVDHGSLGRWPTRLPFDIKETSEIIRRCIVLIGTRRHFPFPRNFAKPKVIQLSLEGCVIGVSEILMEDLRCKSLGIVYLYATSKPFNDLAVIIAQHLGKLIQKLCYRMCRRWRGERRGSGRTTHQYH